ncbi:MAG: S-layer family protein [Snowella sp.]|nr:S-layer family protein [Snowella sp.]
MSFFQSYWLKVPVSLATMWLGILVGSRSVFAQLQPDNTLGRESSSVSPMSGTLSDRIDGGAIRGSNLFHSFSEFNVGEGRGVYFANPTGISNIINRVTGNQASSILGKLGVLGSANLFLVNPNGIIFGPHASLDLGGSFVATTANAIQFGNQGVFSATNPDVPPLLTVNPSAFIFNRLRPSPISLNSTKDLAGQRIDAFSPTGTADTFGLQVPDGKSLILLGGDVNLTDSQLNALGGRVEIGSLGGTGTVGLNINNDALSLNFPDNLSLGDISLSKSSRIYTSGDRGGSIQFTGNNIRLLEGSLLSAETFGAESGGNITLNATDAIEIIDIPPPDAFSANITTITYGTGNAGNIALTSKRFLMENGAQMLSLSVGEGDGGDIRINASESVTITGFDPTSLPFRIPTAIVSAAGAFGKAGNIVIETKDLILSDYGSINASSASATTGEGNFVATGSGGNIIINASNSVSIYDSNPTVILPTTGKLENITGISASTSSFGDAGSITINTGTLRIKNGGGITVNSEGEASGLAGNLTINATKTLHLDGVNSLITAQGLGFRPGGNLSLKTEQMTLSNGAQVSVTSPQGQSGNLDLNVGSLQVNQARITASTETGQAGNVNVKATNLIELSGNGGLLVEASNGGTAGNLTIQTGDLRVQNGSTVTVSSPLGQAGNLNIYSNHIFLNNGSLTAETAKTGVNGANINLQLGNFLQMENESLISATATGTANGGNVTISSPTVVALFSGPNGSDIIANAERGRGGNIIINSQGIFGMAEGRAIAGNGSNDIDASSEFGAPGEVQLNTTINPTQGLTTLPETVVDPNTLVAQNACRRGTASQLTRAGRGGLPPNVYEDLNSAAIQVGLVEPAATKVTESGVSPPLSQTLSGNPSRDRAITPAQGWVFNQRGEVLLVAYDPTAMGTQRIKQTESGCPMP